VLRAVLAAMAGDRDGVAWSRRGLFRRVADELGDLQRARAQLRAVEADMVAVLGELGLSRLGDIPGLTVAGAAVILAEAGDPRRTRRHRRWSSTPGCRRPTTPRARPRAPRGSPAAAAPGCGPRPGG
jgi:transposase